MGPSAAPPAPGANRPGLFEGGNSPIRNRTPLGSYRRPVPRVLGDFKEGGHFLMGEVPRTTLDRWRGLEEGTP